MHEIAEVIVIGNGLRAGRMLRQLTTLPEPTPAAPCVITAYQLHALVRRVYTGGATPERDESVITMSLVFVTGAASGVGFRPPVSLSTMVTMW